MPPQPSACPVEVSNRTNSQGALVDWQKCARPLGHHPPHMDTAEIAALLAEQAGVLRLHCEANHDLRPQSDLNGDDLRAWHRKDHTIIKTHDESDQS